MIRISGIDPSISGTGKCIMELDDDYNVNDIWFYGWTSTKNRSMECNNVKVFHVGTKYDTYSVLERQEIAYPLIHEGMDDVSFAAFEGYAFGKSATNSLVQLGEFNGGLKRELWRKNIGITIYPPAVVKRFATGKGTADKVMMSAAFKQCFPELYPYKAFDLLKQDDSPHADMVDAFWICETLRCHMKYHKLGRDTLPVEIIGLLESKSGKKAMSIVETPVNKKSSKDSIKHI
jgi:Holliday junction resolvasome RuvABC endonuclease subunit